MNPQTARELKAAQYVLSYGTAEKPLVLEALEELIEKEDDFDKIGALLKIKVVYEDLVVEWRGQIADED